MENFSSSPGETSDIEKPAHILLIEDCSGDIHRLRLALDQQGHKYELQVLRDGAEALLFVDRHRMASISDPEPCVIILDLHIPKHGGVAVLQAIRRAPVLSHIHILVLTSATSPEEELEARYLGVRLYREKPRDLSGFLQVAQLIFEICNKGERVPA
jgi:CheY-like chemotaxis protein